MWPSPPVRGDNTKSQFFELFNVAESWGWRASGKNPCRFVGRYKVEKHHERFLTPEEFDRPGDALREADANGSVWPPAIAAIRLLLLTGCHKGEIRTLRWEDMDRTARELRLRDTKSGPRMVLLTPRPSHPLCGMLSAARSSKRIQWGIPDESKLRKESNGRCCSADRYRL